MTVDATYNTDNYTEQGADITEIGGELNILSGGELDIESGAYLQFGGVAQSGCVRAGNYTVVTADDTANKITVTTGLTTVASFNYHILRTGVNVSSAEVVTFVGGVVTITDSTYAATAGDVLYWIAVGS